MKRRRGAILVAAALVAAGSSTMSTTSIAAPSPPGHGCSETDPGHYNRMDNPNTLVLDVSFACPLPGPYRGNEFATMRGPFSPLGPLSGNEGDRSYIVSGDWFQVDPCKLSGGSDLPGAVLIYKTVISGPGPNRGLSAVNYWTLPTQFGGPVLTAGSTPPHGTRVHPGEVIKIHITATEANGGAPESGIQEIALGLSPLLTIDKATYGDHPTACDKSRLTKTLTASYTVPDNPPPIITLIATARDFDNNQAEPLSADFPTADVWTGKAHIVTHTTYQAPPLCAATTVVDSTFNLVVGANGAVKGTRTWVVHATSCESDKTQGPYTFPQFGVVTGGQFHLTYLVVDPHVVTVVPISPSGKTATASVTGGPYVEHTVDETSTSTWTGTISLTCKTC
jgi:hypothetical protein